MLVELAIGLAAVVSAASGILANRGYGKRRDVLTALARWMDGLADHPGAGAHGTCDGIPTVFHLATRGDGSAREAWTEIECRVPSGYPLALHLTRQRTSDAERIARGELIDVVVGHRRFDEHFLVEAAPADVIRRLLTPEVCGWLLQQGQLELDTVDGKLRLALPRWLLDEQEARAAIAWLARLAVRVRAAYLAADAAIRPTAHGDPYRGIPDDRRLEELRATRASEVEALRRRRRKR